MDLATEKRARKKAARDALLAARAVEARRRRLARLGAVGLVIALIVGLALFSGGDDDTPTADSSSSPAAPSDSDDSPPAAATVACGGSQPLPAEPRQYDSPPDLELADGVDYSAVLHTSCGDITIDLLEEKAPASTANFIYLAQEGFYDGLIWHRVENNAVIQSGDPDGQNGVEPDGPGYQIPDEFPERAAEYIYGTVGMANSGPGTTGSQFFVVVHDPERSCDRKGQLLTGDAADSAKAFYCPAGYQPVYSIFGQVLSESFATLQAIAALETQGGNDPVEAVKPVTPVYIESIDIIEG